MTTWRTRVAEFFALDSGWVRVPTSDSRRRDATLALVLFGISTVALEMLRSGGGLRAGTPVWEEYLGLAAMAAPITPAPRTVTSRIGSEGMRTR